MLEWFSKKSRVARYAEQIALIPGIFCLLMALQDAGAEMITITKPYKNTAIKMAVGDTLQIDLEQLGSAGYLWDIENPDTTLFEVAAPQTVEAPRPSEIVGAPVIRRWLITARKTGAGELRFVHYRPWEGKEKASEKLSFKIQIR